MKIHIRFLLIFWACIAGIHGMSQQAPIGQWSDELPYNKVISVTEADHLIYAATPYALLRVDKEDFSVSRLTKINGLSDIGITATRYNQFTGTLVVTYSNANIDLIHGHLITNISDIKRKQILGNKTINSIFCYNKYAYLACGFGIVVLDLQKEEIRDTYYIGPDGSPVNVLAITSDPDDTIYAATDLGIYKAYLNDPNLVNFASWHLDPRIDTFARYPTIATMDEKVFVNKSTPGSLKDTIFIHQNGNWTAWNNNLTSPVMKLEAMYNHLIVVYDYFMYVFDQDLHDLVKIWNYNPGSPYPLDGIEDQDQWLWIGDTYAGLISYNMPGDYFEAYNLGGPLSAQAFSLTAHGNTLLISPGGRDNSYVPLYSPAQVYKLDQDNWTNYAGWSLPALNSYHDVVTTAIDPYDGTRFYAGTWGNGLLEFHGDSLVNRYGEWNSTLRHHSASDTADVRVGGVSFDPAGNMWVVTTHTNSCLSVKHGSQWTGFTIPEVQESNLGNMISTRFGQQWIVMYYGNMNPYSILVFTTDLASGNPGNYQVRKLNSTVGNGNLAGFSVLAMAEDKDGEIWIGTEKGVCVFYSPENIFIPGQDFDAQRILVEYGGYYQYLLENESVTAIAVDGSNKKWIGTDRSGLFLFSEDGTKEILHFTTDNSPLFSNRITSLAINKDGEVFIGTDKGVISYRGSASEGEETMSDVYAFHNPVKDGYNGYIGIKGLVSNEQIRITDSNGELVYATRAEGGQAIWDGKNFSGRKAKSGVYLVFASDDKGKEKVVTKILIIN